MKLLWKTAYFVVPPIALCVIIASFDAIVHWVGQVTPPCVFYAYLGKYCPGCGNTRSLTALAHGDVLGSLRYNLSMIFITLVGLLFYIEKGLILLGVHVKLLPRSNAFLFGSLAFFFTYFVVRNFIPYLTPPINYSLIP